MQDSSLVFNEKEFNIGKKNPYPLFFWIFSNPDASEKELREFFKSTYGGVKESTVPKPESYKGAYDVKKSAPISFVEKPKKVLNLTEKIRPIKYGPMSEELVNEMIRDFEEGIHHSLKPEYPSLLRQRSSKIMSELQARLPKDPKQEDTLAIKLKIFELEEISKSLDNAEKTHGKSSIAVMNVQKDLETMEKKIITALHL